MTATPERLINRRPGHEEIFIDLGTKLGMETFGELIKGARERGDHLRQRISVAMAARDTELSIPFYYAVERGEQRPSMFTLARLLRAYPNSFNRIGFWGEDQVCFYEDFYARAERVLGHSDVFCSTMSEEDKERIYNTPIRQYRVKCYS